MLTLSMRALGWAGWAMLLLALRTGHAECGTHARLPTAVDVLPDETEVQVGASVDPVPLARVLSAIHRIAHFFLNNTHGLNLDAVLGTRIAEGQFRVVLERLVSAPSTLEVSEADALTIYRLLDLTKRVSDRTIPLLRARHLLSFQRLSELLKEGFWAVDSGVRRTEPQLVFPVVSADETLSEEVSDQCIAEMLGKGELVEGPCAISANCWDTMTRSHISGYSLTHGVIYLLVGERMGCEKEMDQQTMRRKQMTSYKRLIDVACANSLQEMKETAAKQFPVDDRDLFMEQTAICGMLGFQDFFSHSWLKAMLSWQKAEGCYGVSSGWLTENRSRRKREEKLLPDGCLAHKSTVALAALAVYVHQLAIDPELSAHFQHNE